MSVPLMFAFEKLVFSATLNPPSVFIPLGAIRGNKLKLMLQKREGKYPGGEGLHASRTRETGRPNALPGVRSWAVSVPSLQG